MESVERSCCWRCGSASGRGDPPPGWQHVEDLDRAIAFYTRLIGEPPIARFDPPGLAFFRLGDTRLLLERGAPTALIYLRVDDVAPPSNDCGGEGVVASPASRM